MYKYKRRERGSTVQACPGQKWMKTAKQGSLWLMEPHHAGRTEYGVPNDNEENVEQQSRHVLLDDDRSTRFSVAPGHRTMHVQDVDGLFYVLYIVVWDTMLSPSCTVRCPGRRWTVLRSLHRRLGHHAQSFLHRAVPRT